MDRTRLAGTVALITGGSRGIGRAVAVRFASEGARIAINHWRDQANSTETLNLLAKASQANGHGGVRHCAFEADVGNVLDCATMLDAWTREAGRLDILVNNAGLLSAEAPGDTFDAVNFARTLSVNLASAAALSAAATRHFLAKPDGPERGAIINTTSVHEMIPKPGYLGYAASKAGLGMLTRTLALEYADRGIRVNAVGPGAIETPMNDSWRGDDEKRRAVAAHIPMGHAAQPDDIAAIYAFLASAEARYITGQTIYACGGLTLFADFKHNWAS